MRFIFLGLAILSYMPVEAQKHHFSYQIETTGTVASGSYTPLWLTANRYGMGANVPHNGYLRAGAVYHKNWNKNWNIQAGLDIATGIQTPSACWIQQAYFDIAWKQLQLSIGSKERTGFPLEKNERLSSGWMTEGPNTRPVPQIRAEIKEYLSFPFLNDWLAMKGHLAYGKFVDDNWQENFAGANATYTRDVMYHSKSLMFRLGKKEKFPVEFEFGLLMATQFAGDQLRKRTDGSSELVLDMPDNLKNYWNAFFPSGGGSDTPWGEQVNVEGNMLGSWLFALNFYKDEWKLRIHLDHYFEDHSQMFWEYGRWKDGQIGIEITPPQNRWISAILWEGISTKDQTGSILYDGFAGSFGDLQVSGNDNYYNHSIYNAWQHYGLGMGNPLIPGPLYNEDGSLTFRSNRIKGQHWGISGTPNDTWCWRLLLTHVHYWGTYINPLDKVRKQFYSLAEITYTPHWTSGWSFSLAGAMDRGNYLGNSTGGMITLRKAGIF